MADQPNAVGTAPREEAEPRIRPIAGAETCSAPRQLCEPSPPVLAVASTGGHLVELRHLVPRMGFDDSAIEWATFEDAQSRSLLAGEQVHYVPPTPPRDFKGIAANVRPALAILRSKRYSRLVSTGSGIALSFLLSARVLGLSSHYVESATRLEGPSATGRILARVPGVRTYTQNEGWAGNRWLFRGSVFDSFERSRVPGVPSLDRIVVTLGMNPYGFRRLIQRLLAVLPSSVEVVWQTGATDTTGLPISAHATLPAHELDEAIRAADVVVAHAGIGSALAALDAGHIPVLVPRSKARGEQIDDHQQLVAAALARQGLAVAPNLEDIDLDILRHASTRRAAKRQLPPRFELI